MKKGIYTIIRFLFGLYIIWLGIINIHEMNHNQTYIQHSITNYQDDINIHNILHNYQLQSYISPKYLNIFHISFNSAMYSLSQHKDDLIYLITFIYIIGGILCSLGYKISSKFIQSAILLDLFFIHSYYYYRDEIMKVNVLKLIAILGGTSYII